MINYKKLSYANYLGAILLLGFILRIWVAQTPMLGTWDERTHALVAKHVMEHPLKPTLFDDPLLPYDYKDWFSCHVWLEKPPLPFWFMAGAMRVFGVSEIAVRLPSILLSTACIWLAFLIGRRLYGNKVGLYTAFFYAVNGKILEVAGGRLSSDHVETAFLFFFQLGLYFIIVYWKQKKVDWRLALAIGIATGLAFMCKWIAAAFLPIIWVCIGLGKKQAFFSRSIWRDASLIGIGTILVALPWCLYIWSAFPLESRHAFERVFLFVNSTVEGHNHPWYNHFSNARIIFGELIYLPMLWLIYRCLKKPKLNSSWSLAVLLLIPLALISCMETKRSTYIFVAAMGFFVLNGLFICYLKQIRHRLQLPQWLIGLVLLLLVLLPVRYGIERLKPFHSFEEERRITASVKILKDWLPDEDLIAVFNEPHHLRAMFYHDIMAYPWVPATADLERIKAKGYRIFIREEAGLKEWH